MLLSFRVRWGRCDFAEMDSLPTKPCHGFIPGGNARGVPIAEHR